MEFPASASGAVCSINCISRHSKSVHFARPILRRQWQKRLYVPVLKSSSRKQFMGAKLFWSQCWINLIVASYRRHGVVVLCRIVPARTRWKTWILHSSQCWNESVTKKVGNLSNLHMEERLLILRQKYVTLPWKNIKLNAPSRIFDGFDWNKRDKRLDGFPLMSSIWPTIFISLAYVNLAKIVGPFLMRNKSPLKLDKFARCYNTTQFLCELLLIPWLSVYFFSTGNSWSK